MFQGPGMRLASVRMLSYTGDQAIPEMGRLPRGRLPKKTLSGHVITDKDLCFRLPRFHSSCLAAAASALKAHPQPALQLGVPHYADLHLDRAPHLRYGVAGPSS
jgi:hypothetical protein